MSIKYDTFVIPAVFAVVAIESPFVLHAQEVERAGAAYESRFAETPDLRLQYMDFGGSGLPVIFVQDFHNYFDSEFDSEWPGFYARFADDYRVLAPIRRGYGESDDTGWGYDVATQSEDLLGFMDALGISRAVLVGRQPANQDMTWIAEHHPERVAGLVYMGNPLVFPDLRNPLVRTFEEMTWRSCDLGEESVAIVGPRASWRPDFLHDEDARVNIPALRFVSPWDTRTVSLRALPRIAQTGINSRCDDEARQEYFAALAADEEQVAAIREAIVEADLFPTLDRSMERAFGGSLRTEVDDLPNGDGWAATHDFYEPHMRSFLEEVADIEAGGSEGAAADTIAGEVVHVAPPTGDRESDRASILAALGEVGPGDTIQFAPGTYLMGGEIIRITIPRVTLAGHPEGTTLKGCHPDEFPMQDPAEFGNNCNGLELAGGWQTVRNLTFEHAFWALHVGCCWDSSPHMLPGEGGHLIEANTFRSNSNAVRVHGYWSAPTVIRNNRFLNNWHSVAVYGNTVHLLDNDISAPKPEEVQWFGFPADGIHIARPQSLHESAEGVTRTCENNVVSGNRIDGVTEGIMMTADDPQIICRNNVIRENTIIIRRARPPVMPDFIRVHDEADSTVVGVPLALRGPIEDNLIEGNVIRGAEGLGIEVRNASRNRIVNNTITGVERRDPFPGNAIVALPVIGGDPEAWRQANGAGIWISPGSNGNEIAGNTFRDVAGAAIVLEGDSSQLELHSPSDAVRDLGTGNRVRGPGGPAGAAGEPTYESRFVQVRGIRMHYLDFGGSGLPVIFLHGGHGDARNFVDFAPRFADGFRVLALDRRGKGESEIVDWGYGTAAQAEDVLGFMDALGLEEAVLIGNVADPVAIMTYLAEHHPDRLAGVVYLAHQAPAIDSHREPVVAEFWDMAIRTACDWDEEQRRRETQRDGYRPHFIDDPELRIDVPALSFANADGTRYPADFDFLGFFLQGGATREWCDPAAKEYFSALAADTVKADELRGRLGDLSGTANLGAFERAFGPRMTVVRLDVPAVTGYETERAPDLIEPHIRRFLDEVKSAELRTARADTVYVAAPTGNQTTDRASILAALDQVQPGNVILFAPGTYVVGEIVPIETAQLTILGHADGTTLRGCDPRAYERMEGDVEAAGDDQRVRNSARLTCGVFEMTGGHGTIRGLTFEYTWIGLALGEKWIGVDLGSGHSSERPVTDGGYLVEGNVFRNSANGVRPGDLSGAPTVIRGNRFMNLGHAVSAGGAGIHVLDNDISVPDPQSLLSPQGPLFAIGISSAQECIVEGNRIDGHPSGIILFGSPGKVTRRNVIRDNTITVRGAGLPLGLWGGQEDADGIEIEDNLIERNRIMGGTGVGIALNRASRNRILQNTITGIELGDPSLGESNGAGLWVSPGSDENEIVGNTFEDIATEDVVLEGDRNVVRTHSGSEAVRDLGTGNRMIGPDSAVDSAAGKEADQPADAWPPPGMGAFVAIDEMGPIIPVRAEAAHHLMYELRLTSFDPRVLELDSLEVLDGDPPSRVVAAYGAAELRRMIEYPGRSADDEPTRIVPGSHAVLFLWLDLGSAEPPARLRHRLLLRNGQGPEAEVHRLTTDALPVSKEPTLVVGAPLRGGPWYAHAGPANASHHRRLFAPRDGTYTIDTRFASDWLLLEEHVTGSDDLVYIGPDWAGTSGSQVFSATDGRVVAVVDGLPDDPIGPLRPGEVIDWQTIGGNRITVAIGDGRFAWYVHLRPGSLTVQPGDSVTRGQLLGLVGNSGNSGGPHLHFEITDSETLGKGEGLPFVFECFDLVARADEMPRWDALLDAGGAEGALWDSPLRPRAAAERRRTNEMPLGGAVVVFPMEPRGGEARCQ